jgi:ParB family chromosome partitioning protein
VTDVGDRHSPNSQETERADSQSGDGADAGAVRIPLREIRLNLANPRKQVDERELAELAASIRQHGLLQPILVRRLSADERRRDDRKYQIVIGSRRYFAAERAGLEAIDCYVRGMSSEDAVVASFLDHAHHRTLTDTEEADFLRYLRHERKMRLREIAALLAKSIAYVSRRLGVFGDPRLEEAVRGGRITQAAAQEILRAPEAWWPTLVERTAGLTRGEVRRLVEMVGAADFTPAAVERIFSQRKEPAPARHESGGPRAYDERLRRDGPVRRVASSPAREVLRLVNEWTNALPTNWRPTAEEMGLIEETVRRIEDAAGFLPLPPRTRRSAARSAAPERVARRGAAGAP